MTTQTVTDVDLNDPSTWSRYELTIDLKDDGFMTFPFASVDLAVGFARRMFKDGKMAKATRPMARVYNGSTMVAVVEFTVSKWSVKGYRVQATDGTWSGWKVC